MSTPSWVSFPISDRSPSELVHATTAAFMGRDIELIGVSELQAPSTEETIECSGETIPCNSEDLALAIANDWFGYVLTYSAFLIRGNLYVYLWPSGNRTVIALEVSSQALYFKSAEYREGEWLEQLLTALTAALNADGCLYGFDDMMYVPLDVKRLANTLGNGTERKWHHPLFCMLAQNTINENEIYMTLKKTTMAGYRHIAIGHSYHIVSNLVRETSARLKNNSPTHKLVQDRSNL